MIPLPLFIPIGAAAVLPVASGLRGVADDNGALLTMACVGALALTVQAKRRRERKTQQVDDFTNAAMDLGSVNATRNA